MSAPKRALAWASSPVDYQAHLVDPLADHPEGVYRAHCGHTLLMSTPLGPKPTATKCPTCRSAAEEASRTWWADEAGRTHLATAQPDGTVRAACQAVFRPVDCTRILDPERMCPDCVRWSSS